jgi:hypothetical protein
MKSLKKFFSELNKSLPKKLENYELSLETLYEVFKLNQNKQVTRYCSIYERDLEVFEKNKNFFYFVEPSSVFLCAYITNSKGERLRFIVGAIQFYTNKEKETVMYLNLQSQLKTLKRFIRKSLNAVKLNSPSYSIAINKELYDTVPYTKYPVATTRFVYEVKFSNGLQHLYEKESANFALDCVINKQVQIQSANMKHLYQFQQPTIQNLIN